MKILIDKNKINIKKCVNFKNRLKGLMFEKKQLNYGLCFPKCNSIHTFFMLQNINVIMTDKNFKVIKIYKNLKPFKIVLSKKNIYYTFEFTLNIDLKNIKENDFLKIEN